MSKIISESYFLSMDIEKQKRYINTDL